MSIIFSLPQPIIYEEFFKLWFKREQVRLKGYFDLIYFFEFAEEVAFEIFLAGETQISDIPQKSLFKRNQEQLDRLLTIFSSSKPDFIRARSGCPIQRSGDNKYRFMHKSFQEFCAAKKLYRELKKDYWKNLNKKLLTQDPAIIQFLAEMDINKDILLAIINKSKNNPEIKIASSNAISILNTARFSFSNKNLKGIRIPGADLSNAVLDKSDLFGANITGASLKNAYLKDAIFSSCKMENVDFGERPYLKGHKKEVTCICFSPDGVISEPVNENETIFLKRLN